MPTLSLGQAQFIGAGVIYDMIGQPLSVSTVAVPIAVWPQVNSVEAAVARGNMLFTGVHPTQVNIRPGGPLLFRPNLPPVNDGSAAVLAAGVEYWLPLHPSINTLFFLAPIGTSAQINWCFSG